MNILSAVHDELIIGTRGSNLALWQANHVASLLSQVGISARLKIIITKGDGNLDQPLADIGDKGLFTSELDNALIADRIHLAVHSLKDLPTELPPEIRLTAVPERGHPWDVLIPQSQGIDGLMDLPKGALIGSSSLRRIAQLLAARPDFTIQSIRGNVETRLRKLHDENLDAIVLAEAGMTRLGLQELIGARLPFEVMMPAVGQGALGIVCASHRTSLRKTLSDALNHRNSFTAAETERAFLRRLEGGCQVPIGAYCHVRLDDTIELHGCVATLDGSTILRDKIEAPLGASTRAGTMLAERLIDLGADNILHDIRAEE
jgi:hydroxymethylbilane synthase